MPKLHPAGQEYRTATITDAPTQTIAVSFDGGTTWPKTCTRVDTTHVRFLVAGPSFSGPDPTATVLALGSTDVYLRDLDNPETVIRFAGRIDVGLQ